ncbi:MAG: Dna2/Cas4 domain-containing protein [Methanocellales archaeon]
MLRNFARVSEIVICLNCPRQLYFTLNSSIERKNIIAHLIHLFLRELGFRIPSLLVNEQYLLDELKKALEVIAGEINLIYRNDLINVDGEQLLQAKNAVEVELQNIANGIKKSIEIYGKAKLYQLISPWRIEEEMNSSKHMLVGRVDKIVRINEEVIPSIIKTGTLPEYGVWYGDRIQLTAYSILIEEKFDVAIERGIVEYTRFGTLREIAIKNSDRRKVLEIRDKVLRIKNGYFPEPNSKNQCNHCSFKTSCESRVSLASKYF